MLNLATTYPCDLAVRMLATGTTTRKAFDTLGNNSKEIHSNNLRLIIMVGKNDMDEWS